MQLHHLLKAVCSFHSLIIANNNAGKKKKIKKIEQPEHCHLFKGLRVQVLHSLNPEPAETAHVFTELSGRVLTNHPFVFQAQILFELIR